MAKNTGPRGFNGSIYLDGQCLIDRVILQILTPRLLYNSEFRKREEKKTTE